MPYVDLKHVPVRRANPFAAWRPWAQRGLTSMFAVSVLLDALTLCDQSPASVSKQFADGLLLLSAAATTLLSLCSQVPAQNVILTAVTIGGAAGLVHFVNGLAAVPLGPLSYHTENIGRFIVDPLPWSVPVLWVVIILNARGVARLMLRSKRRASHYGFWVLGTTVALVVLFALSFEPFATQVKQYWSWTPTKVPWDWYSAPWTSFLACAVMTFLILLFVTPALINKNPKPRPASFHPLFIWQALSALLLLGTALAHLRTALVLILIQMLGVGILAVLGAGKVSSPS